MKKNKNIPITNEEKHLHDLHIAEKFAMQEEKNTGKLKDENYFIPVFYLQTKRDNFVESWSWLVFLQKKLTLYNLTAITLKKQGYCAIWIEWISCLSGSNIASAFIQILKKVVLLRSPKCDLVNFFVWELCASAQESSHLLIFEQSESNLKSSDEVFTYWTLVTRIFKKSIKCTSKLN